MCVPTPLTPNREPDLTPLVDACQSIATVLQAGQLVVLESTTYPGTTRERALPILEESGSAALSPSSESGPINFFFFFLCVPQRGVRLGEPACALPFCGRGNRDRGVRELDICLHRVK